MLKARVAGQSLELERFQFSTSPTVGPFFSSARGKGTHRRPDQASLAGSGRPEPTVVPCACSLQRSRNPRGVFQHIVEAGRDQAIRPLNARREQLAEAPRPALPPDHDGRCQGTVPQASRDSTAPEQVVIARTREARADRWLAEAAVALLLTHACKAWPSNTAALARTATGPALGRWPGDPRDTHLIVLARPELRRLVRLDTVPVTIRPSLGVTRRLTCRTARVERRAEGVQVDAGRPGLALPRSLAARERTGTHGGRPIVLRRPALTVTRCGDTRVARHPAHRPRPIPSRTASIRRAARVRTSVAPPARPGVRATSAHARRTTRAAQVARRRTRRASSGRRAARTVHDRRTGRARLLGP